MSKSFKYKTSNYIFVASRLCRDPRLLLAYCLSTLLSAITQIATLALLGDFITQVISTNNSGVLGTQKLLSIFYNFLLSYISDFELSTLIGLCFIFSSILNLVFTSWMSILGIRWQLLLKQSLQLITKGLLGLTTLMQLITLLSMLLMLSKFKLDLYFNHWLFSSSRTSIVICSAILISLLQSNFSITIVISLLIFASYLVIFSSLPVLPDLTAQ